MSRGLGRVQRLIIEKLAPRHTGYVPSMPARSLLKSMNRAEFGAGPEPGRGGAVKALCAPDCAPGLLPAAADKR
jgi:hypothetical protein